MLQFTWHCKTACHSTLPKNQGLWHSARHWHLPVFLKDEILSTPSCWIRADSIPPCSLQQMLTTPFSLGHCQWFMMPIAHNTYNARRKNIGLLVNTDSTAANQPSLFLIAGCTSSITGSTLCWADFIPRHLGPRHQYSYDKWHCNHPCKRQSKILCSLIGAPAFRLASPFLLSKTSLTSSPRLSISISACS